MEKKLRKVRDYKRGGHHIVHGYLQHYHKPRGAWSPLKADSLKSSNITIWLKDSYGHFIGRANVDGKTTANKKLVKQAAPDRTTNYRESGRYGRIKGRQSQPMKGRKKE